MATFPYTTVPGKIKTLFEKIPTVGVPEKVTIDWLKSIAFKSSNDPSLRTVLKHVGFVDSHFVPQQRWKDYRNKGKSKEVMREAVLEAYEELFATYPDAQTRSYSDLRDFFAQHVTAGEQVVDKTVATFKALCSLADFSGWPAAGPSAAPDPDPTARQLTQQPADAVQGIALNINIQLVLPEGMDADGYDKFFAAMRRHLFRDGQ